MREKLIWYIGSWCPCAWDDGLGESGGLWYVLTSDCRVMVWVGWLTGCPCADYKIYEKAVEVTHKLKPIFYDANE